MAERPASPEIYHRSIKLLIGLIAISLASLTNFLSATDIASVSASYYEGDWPRNIFVGCLFAIAAFLLAYNGWSLPELILSKVAALSALGVAMFPCGCGSHPEIIRHVHAFSAAGMFLVLAIFCFLFFNRALDR